METCLLFICFCTVYPITFVESFFCVTFSWCFEPFLHSKNVFFMVASLAPKKINCISSHKQPCGVRDDIHNIGATRAITLLQNDREHRCLFVAITLATRYTNKLGFVTPYCTLSWFCIKIFTQPTTAIFKLTLKLFKRYILFPDCQHNVWCMHIKHTSTSKKWLYKVYSMQQWPCHWLQEIGRSLPIMGVGMGWDWKDMRHLNAEKLFFFLNIISIQGVK